jgi:ATP-dependent helicase/DNAse subunit B
MQILTGPPGSGKTFSALKALRTALRRGDCGVRLLVPTATMAQHVRNEMAREGFVFSPSMIQTIARFIQPHVMDFPEVSDAFLHLLVERSVHRLRLHQFDKVTHFTGFHAKLAKVIEECASAGCSVQSLRNLLPKDALGDALARVFEETSQSLAARNLALRSTRLALAAVRIAETGTGPAKTIWLDGFFSLADPELALIEAMTKHADLTVTLPSDEIATPTRVRLVAMGFEERALTRTRVPSTRKLLVAPGIEREADEIARGILEQVAGGRQFREIGIILRSSDLYAPLLRATFERFGIPARFYFDSVLMEQAAVRYLAGAVDAMLDGWQHDQTLTIMKLAPGAGASGPMDRFDFEVRMRMPGAGLQPLRELAAGIRNTDKRLLRLLDGFADLDAWRPLQLTPPEWFTELMKLRALYRLPRPRDQASRDTALEWRSQAQALTAFESAIEEAARFLDGSARLPLDQFWPAVKTALQFTPLRLTDQRRNVVHVLSAHEARQWELPVVFVCGLVEGQFPLYQAPDPFLPDHVRRRLKEGGLRIRTASDLENAERFLYDSAINRATESVIVSYPKNDPRGEQNLPSLFLDPAEPRTATRPVRAQTASPPESPTVPAAIRSADLLQVIGQRHREIRPTGLESYLQCPFQFFGGHTLKLEGAPPRPGERFDFRLRGNIVHQAIREWLESGTPMEPIFERVFAELTGKAFVVPGYQAELLRAQMLDDLRRFVKAESWPADHQSQPELSCRFELGDGVAIRCRLDRLLKTSDGRAFVVEYKYSPNLSNYTANEDRVQGPLYWLAAERGFQLQVAGVYYCSLRDSIQYAGWGEKPDWLKKGKVEGFTPEWLQGAIERSMQAARAIAAGRIAPDPSDLSKCRYCDFRDACRYQGAEVTTVAECAV